MPTDAFPSSRPLDLLIVGAGPAGLLLANAAVREGLRVGVVDGAPMRAFEATFGLYEDELAPQWGDAVAGRWSSARVLTDGGQHDWQRPYVRLDSDRLQQSLHKVFTEGAARHVGTVQRAQVTPEGLCLAVMDNGVRIHARRLVDATGHRPAIVPRGHGSLAQVALGAVVEATGLLDAPLLMDFREVERDQPTFLYAMPMEDGRLFVEETSLVTGRRPSWSQLRSRLEARLDRMGMGEYPLTLVERCIIPMDSPLPDLTSPFVAFGASASMVHPATGYQLAAAMRHAPALANSLAQSMDDTLVRASALAWDVLWPAERRRVRELHLFGTRFVATLEGPEQAAFFDHFFSLPPDLRRAYLSIDAGLTEVCQAMLSLFRELPGSLRWRLARRGASSPLPLVRPILGV